MILEKIIEHAISAPANVAIVDDKRTLTYRELAYGANLFVDHLATLAPAATSGDKVGLLIPPTTAFAVAFCGTRWAGRIAMPLNYLLKPDELVAIVRDSGVKIIFTIEHFRPLTDAIAAATGVNVVFMESLKFEKPGLAAMASIGMNPANLRKHLQPLPPQNDDDVAVILYTSGTSGTPKGVMLTNRNLESNAVDGCAHARFTEKTVFLGVLPMFHAFGLTGCMNIPLMLGSKVVFQARFSPMGVFEAVKNHAVEVLLMVPTMYAVMANAKSGSPESLKSVRLAVSGGEALPVTLIEQFHKKFNITLMEGFGLTETSPIVALSMPWAHKPGSVGKPIPNAQVKTVDDAGADLPSGADGGEVWLKGPNIMKGYYNKPDLTAEVITPDGWFKTGDIGRIDDEGYLYITGRKKDMIIMAGEKVFPREIEDAIKQHPAILLAAVIGAKDEKRGEAPVAFVQLKPEVAEAGGSEGAMKRPTEADIRAWVRDRIAPYKAPRDVFFMEHLPLGPTGKVQKRDLKIPPEK